MLAMSLNRYSNFRLVRTLTLAILVFANAYPCCAQDLRYELGARLRMFERDFESVTSPEERARALPQLSNCVQLFFGMQLQNAVKELDSARVAIQAENCKEILSRAINLRLVCSTKLFDPDIEPLKCTIVPQYGQPDWDGLLLRWEVCPVKNGESDSALASGQIELSSAPSQEIPVETGGLPLGDYILRLSVQNAQSSQPADSATSEVALIQRIFSIARQPAERLENLANKIQGLGPTLDATQVHSLRHNMKTLQRILDGASLETDFPAAALLQQSEEAAEKLLAGSNAYGNGQPGEYWLEAVPESGRKWMRLRAPKAAAAGIPLPLVIALHGAGGSENMFFDTYGDGKIVRLAEDRQWLLVAPRVALGGLQLEELIEAVDKLYPVERNAVFIVGHSMGAGAAISMSASAQKKPAAVAALGGGRGVSDVQPLKDIPFLVAAGSHDFGRSGAKQLADSLQKGHVDVKYRDYENVEHLAIVQVALDDVFAFFDDHSANTSNAASPPKPDALRIDQLQLLGTHNSYHLEPDEVAMKTIAAVVPREAESLQNSQRPLREQFEILGVRHVELDLFLDPEGKLFSQPMAYTQAQRQNADVPEFDPSGKMKQPGIKVLHSPDFDYRTTTYTLIDGLQEIKEWSDANPSHVPVFILLELKSASFSPMTRPLPWTQDAFDELEREILSVWPRERILTPDDVRGEADTLREAVEGRGWPSVDSQRGKVVFLLDNEGSLRDLYLTKSPILENRLLFTSVRRHHPAAAWFKRNDPIGSYDEIVELVKAGFLVRTRADVGTVQARKNETHRRETALASGAQLISTDYPEPDPRFSDYSVTLPAPDEPKSE